MREKKKKRTSITVSIQFHRREEWRGIKKAGDRFHQGREGESWGGKRSLLLILKGGKRRRDTSRRGERGETVIAAAQLMTPPKVSRRGEEGSLFLTLSQEEKDRIREFWGKRGRGSACRRTKGGKG